MQKVMKKPFEADGKKLAVVRPDHRKQQKAQLAQNRAFREAIRPEDGSKGAIVRSALESVLREQKLWDDAKAKRWAELNEAISAGEKALAAGGIKLSEARAKAIQMRRDRAELRRLLADRNALDLMTAEAQAENARFNYLVFACTVYDGTGKPYWKDEEAYHADAHSAVAGRAAELLGHMIYGLDEDFEAKLPENRWLSAFGFADAKGRLIDKEGRYVDAEGRLVNEEGHYVDAEGRLVDFEGQPVTPEGEYIVEARPFLDEDGSPVPMPEALQGAKAPLPEAEKPVEAAPAVQAESISDR
jgi:hypothetical protein